MLDMSLLETEHARRRLDREAAGYAMKGYIVSGRGEFFIVMRRQGAPNHAFHILLCFITFGLWVPFYLFLTMVRRDHRVMIKVDPKSGMVSKSSKRRGGM